MSQSNYKEEVLELFRHIRANKISDNDALVAIDRLNATVVGEDEPIDLKEEDIENLSQVDYENIAHIGGKNELRSELRQAFGVDVTDIFVGNLKEDK